MEVLVDSVETKLKTPQLKSNLWFDLKIFD